jgi:hypothetical protein
MPSTRNVHSAHLLRSSVCLKGRFADLFFPATKNAAHTVIALGVAFGLAACGGGGGAGGETAAEAAPTTTPVADAAALIATPDKASTKKGKSVTISVLANDKGFGAVAPTVSISSKPANGKAVVRADGSIAYTPAKGFTGVDSFIYKISNGGKAFAVATATVSVTCDGCVADSPRMTLTWNPVPGNVLGYLVYYGNGLIPDPAPVTTIVTKASVTFDARADLGLAPGDYACFWVQSVNAAGISDLSAPACGVV